jgi:predicted permease
MDMRTRWSRIRAAAQRLTGRNSAREAELAAEIESFLEHESEANQRVGMDESGARRAALVEFGGVDQVKEHVRSNRAGAWIDGIAQDIKFAVRSLRQTPEFSIPVIASLSIGVAVTLVGFAFVNALMFRPIPGVSKPDELVNFTGPVMGAFSKGDFTGPLPEDREDMAAPFTRIQGLAVSTAGKVTIGSPVVQSVGATFVSPNYFSLLGVRPAAGTLSAFEDRNVDGVILAYSLWKDFFGSDRSVVGKTLRVANRDLVILGVADESFTGVNLDASDSRDGTMLWLPVHLLETLSGEGTGRSHYYAWIARRKPGVTVAQVQAQERVIYASIAAKHQKSTQPAAFAADETRLIPTGQRAARISLILILSVPLLVLTIATGNAANLILARSSRRYRELAIRLAIGASRWRVVRQLFIESFMLSLAATVVAVPLALWGLRWASLQIRLAMPVDPVALGATLLTVFLCTIGFGLAPALKVTKTQPVVMLGGAMNSGASVGEMRERRRVIAFQVALSVILIAVGFQIVVTLQSRRETVGVQSEGLYLAYFDLTQLKRPAVEVDAFYNRLIDALSKLPQVQSAGAGPSVWSFPLRIVSASIVTVWRPGDAPDSSSSPRSLGGEISKDVFRAVGFSTVEGRGFSDSDYQSSRPQVAIVNRQFAKTHLAGAALGSVLRVAPGFAGDYKSSVEVRVVGVIDDAPGTDPGEPNSGHNAAIYLPSPFDSSAARMVYVRLHNGTTGFGSIFNRTVRSIDGQVPIIEAGTLSQFNNDMMPGLIHWLTGGAIVLGMIALILSTAGLYGVALYTVSTRTREIAIRMTMGAGPQTILKMIWKQAMGLVLTGLVFGLPIAYGAGHAYVAFNAQWTGVEHVDGLLFARSILLVIVPMCMASLIPAIRATRVDPVENLRND